jgi:hypothetical protein
VFVTLFSSCMFVALTRITLKIYYRFKL